MKKKTLYYSLFVASLLATALLTMNGRASLGHQIDNLMASGCGSSSSSSSSSTSGSTGGSSSGGNDSMPQSVIALIK